MDLDNFYICEQRGCVVMACKSCTEVDFIEFDDLSTIVELAKDHECK